MTAPTILFDIDGTLLFLRGVGGRAMDLAIREAWGLENALQGVSFAGATDSGIARRVGDGRPREPMWESYQRHLAGMLEGAGEVLQPLPGVVALLDRLQTCGARLGLLTGNMQGGARLKLGATGLVDYFDFGLSAFAEDGFARTELAEAARRRCGGGTLTIVGDTVADIECARHIGARVLAVSTGPQEHAQLEQARPDRLETDLTANDAIADWLLAPH
mgnify:FL=1